MGRFEREEFMNTAQKHVGHAFTQFALTQNLLNNLSQFKLTPTAKLVLLELSSFYNPKKVDMFPKQKTLAKKIGISERSVVRAIQELLNEGLIMVECKYTNHYKFTSRIVSQQAQNEKIFCDENMSQDLGKKDTKHNDNLAQHEQTIKPIKEPSNMEEFKILRDYANKNYKTTPQAYLNWIMKNKEIQNKIFSEYKTKQKVTQIALCNKQETQNLLKTYQEYEETSESYLVSEEWKKLGQKFGFKRN